ncbi:MULTISPECIES: peptide deformylase [unclassified Halobacteriovorax]|uniref:peptide deformylase n=1 Tax=unclassified Halobacteriovorax TaxID=2639665 RepID=UPI000EA0E807|nr:peptide deformylase [Halobacteriovorax sp. BALOs_7]AYF43635.1 peptide deformylase [Halobacteriovorax sp. BALOs_7]
MTVQKIRTMGDPVLREITQEFTKEEILAPETKELIQDMQDSMKAAGGIGIAAPQIGVSKRVTIIDVPEESRYEEAQASQRMIIFNPKIEFLTQEEDGYWEGCLSVPGLRGFVERPNHIRVSFLDENAKEVVIEAQGFLATVFQHEIDHLFGKLYVDQIKDIKQLVFEENL